MPEQRRTVLVYSGPDDSPEFYNSIHAILSKLLDEQKYEVKQLKHSQVSSGSTKSWATGTDALIVNNDGGNKKFDNSVQKAFLEYFINSGKIVFLCNVADGKDALWLLKTAVAAEKGETFPENVGLAFEKFAQHQPVPANLQSFQIHKEAGAGQPIDYAVGLVRGDSDMSYMHFICEDGDTAVFVVSQSTVDFGVGKDPGKGKTESFWRDILRVLRVIGVEVLPITPSQAAQRWAESTGTAATDAAVPPVEKLQSPTKVMIYLGPGKEENAISLANDLQANLKKLINDKYDIQLLEHEQFIQADSPWKANCAVLFVDNRDWEKKFDEPMKKLLTDYFTESGKVVFFCDPKDGRKAMWLLKAASAPNEQWPEAVSKAYEHFAQNQPVPTDLQAIQTQSKGGERMTELSLGLIKSLNGAFTYLKCEDGDTAVFVAMTLEDVVKGGAFIWSELLRVVGLPTAPSQMPPPSWGSAPAAGELTRVVKFINTGAAAASAAASSFVEGIQDRVSKFLKGDAKTTAMKPPNLLIYVNGESNETAKKFEGLSSAIRQFLAPDKYTLYQLKKEALIGTPWASNCRVLFAENKSISDEIKKAFAEYFLRNGGRLVLLCDPQDGRQALWLLDQAAGGQKWPDSLGEAFERFVRNGERTLPSEVGKFSVGGSEQECCVNLLGGSRGAPPILQFIPGQGGASAVFVGTTLELLCAEKGEDTWTEILGASGLETAKEQAQNVESAGKALGVVFCKNQELAASIKTAHPSGVIELSSMKAQFDEQPSSESKMKFNVNEYFEHLKTKRLGQVVIYTPAVPSTMPVSDDWHNAFGKDDYVVVATQQTRGQGRSGNQWLSPIGSALFTFCVHVPQKSSLGKRLSFLQHLVTLAAADSIHQLHEALNIKIKWPNDIYYGNDDKIGGVLVKANFLKEAFIVYVGTGINVANAAPTVCLNDFLPSGSKPLTPEIVMAITLSRLEQLIEEFQMKGAEAILPLYYKYWLHSNQKVTIAATGEQVTILGLDEYGFLSVKEIGSGKSFTLHPDGNSFDMMANLIKAKEA